MRLTGLHHLTLLCRDVERTTAFYRDLLGLALVQRRDQRRRPRRRATSGSATPTGRPGRWSRSSSTRRCRPARLARARPTTSRSAWSSAEELEAWRDYLRARRDRAPTCSTAAPSDPSTSAIPTATSWRSPLAARDSAAAPDARRAQRDAPRPRESTARQLLRERASRWRSVIDPMVLFSGIGMAASTVRALVQPQRRWLVRRSATSMLFASHGRLRMTSATASFPSATRRLRFARASLTLFARSSARCVAGSVARAVREGRPKRWHSIRKPPSVRLEERTVGRWFVRGLLSHGSRSLGPEDSSVACRSRRRACSAVRPDSAHSERPSSRPAASYDAPTRVAAGQIDKCSTRP